MTTTQRLAAALAVTATMLPPPARADVAVGDKITDANIDKVKDLISPGLEWCIKHGFPMTIGETRRVEWPRGIDPGGPSGARPLRGLRSSPDPAPGAAKPRPAFLE